MSQNPFESSDTTRHAKPLRYAKSAKLDQPLPLELGGHLDGVTVAYETYGDLNAARDNAVLICHAISGDSHVTRHDPDDDPGWWDIAVGPGKVIDTDKFFVICPNLLGSCRGSTGPGSPNPLTGKPYGRDFPTITVADMVEVQHRLPGSRVRIPSKQHGCILPQGPNQSFKHGRSLRCICRGRRNCRRRSWLCGRRTRSSLSRRSCRTGRGRRRRWRFVFSILLLRNLFAELSLWREQPAVYNLKAFVMFGFGQRNLPQEFDRPQLVG